MLRRRVWPLFLVTILGTHAACELDCVCTFELVGISVRVVDEAGHPVEGLESRVTVLRTGERIPVDTVRWGGGYDGWYPVISDRDSRYVNEGGEGLRFTAWDPRNRRRFVTGDFEIDFAGRCHCHVRKVSGPDSLVIR